MGYWNSIHPSHQPCPGGFHQPNHQPQVLGVLNDLPPIDACKKRLQWDLFQGKPLEVSSMHHRPRNCKIWLFKEKQSTDLFVPMKNVSKIKVRKKEQHRNRGAELFLLQPKTHIKKNIEMHWKLLLSTSAQCWWVIQYLLFCTAQQCPAPLEGKHLTTMQILNGPKFFWICLLD